MSRSGEEVRHRLEPGGLRPQQLGNHLQTRLTVESAKSIFEVKLHSHMFRELGQVCLDVHEHGSCSLGDANSELQTL